MIRTTTVPGATWRRFNCALIAAALLLAGSPPEAGELTDSATTQGLKEALSRGAAKAVEHLGQRNGFLGNPRTKIPLPEPLQKAEKRLRKLGAGKAADQLIETMNRAAESAVVEAKPILLDAIKQMTISDGLGILRGGDDGATQFFRRTTSAALTTRFRPVIEASTAQFGVSGYYDRFAGKASQFGLIDAKAANLDGYITEKALDGLFLMVAEEEKRIRKDPVATGSAAIEQVFGSLIK